MLIPNHPDEERVSALASADDDATTDAELRSHVAACARCTEILDDLRSLRATLAELPDLTPSRPLQLLPPVEEAEPAVGMGTWIRRLFAPVMTAGAALALVGVVGTTAPALSGMAQSAGGDSAVEMFTATDEADAGAGGGEAPAAAESTADDGATTGTGQEESQGRSTDDDGEGDLTQLPAERSPWPMLLFTGVALMIGIALLRWILAPRAG
jgi:hypothetical protein